MNISYLKKLHNEILTIMDAIDRVCKDNNLKYYLVGGTLLGAVRHRGFIPWDDDLDIAMPRDDYEKFLVLCNPTLNSDFELEWITTNKTYTYFFSKISKKGTLFKESGRLNTRVTGIFVDIFPLDECPEYSQKLELKKKLINQCLLLGWCKIEPNWRINRFFHSLLGKFINYRLINQLSICIARSAQNAGNTHYANFGSQYRLAKQTMPKEWYGEGKPIVFEDRVYNAPTEYLLVLKSIYGDNYMQLPPENKRRCHYPSKVVFSDGEVMEFDIPQNIVTVKEQEK